MRKKFVLLAAAAALTLAAKTEVTAYSGGNGWTEQADGWCYMQDGEKVTSTWKKGADGTYYYLGESGIMLVNEWVSDRDDNWYYVDENGMRVKSDWRRLEPRDDSMAEEAWYYFNANGKMMTGKQNIKDKKYFFDETGRMLTGWIEWDKSSKEASPYMDEIDEKGDSDIYYCLEDGSRASDWIKMPSPDEDGEEKESYWYNFDGGKVRVNAKEGLDGKDYIFDQKGRMISGWAYKGPGSDGAWVRVDEDTPIEDINVYKEDCTNFYFCNSVDDGSVLKNNWIKTKMFDDLSNIVDEDTAWYYFDKTGRLTSRKATASPSDAMAVTDSSGTEKRVLLYKTDSDAGSYKVKQGGTNVYSDDTPTSLIKKINDKYYIFSARGKHLDGLVYLSQTVSGMKKGYYYFGDNGSMVTGPAVKGNDGTDYNYYFARKKDKGYSEGQGVTGVFGGRLYYEGLAVRAEDGMGWQPAYIECDPANDHGISGWFLVDEDGKVKTGGTAKDANGIKYKVTKKKNIQANKKGYEVQWRDDTEDWKGNDGYTTLISSSDALYAGLELLEPYQYFGFVDDNGGRQPEGVTDHGTHEIEE